MSRIEYIVYYVVLIITPLLVGIALPDGPPFPFYDNSWIFLVALLCFAASCRLVIKGSNKIFAWVFCIFYGLALITQVITWALRIYQ